METQGEMSLPGTDGQFSDLSFYGHSPQCVCVEGESMCVCVCVCALECVVFAEGFRNDRAVCLSNGYIKQMNKHLQILISVNTT